MPGLVELAAAVRTNWQLTLQRLARHSADGDDERFDGVAATFAGVPVPFFNQVFVLEPVADPDALEAAIAWADGWGLPYVVTLSASLDDELRLVEEQGLERDAGTTPGMALAPLEGVDGGRPADDELEVAVARPGDRGAIAAVTAEAFGLSAQVAERLVPVGMFDDPRTVWFVARLDGRVVGCALAVRDESGVVGVYNVAVAPSHRRRGYGTALTAAALDVGAAAGCHTGVLQSSEIGYSVYERMGFRRVADYRHRMR